MENTNYKLNAKLKSRCITWQQYQQSIHALCSKMEDTEFDYILGIFQGGYIVAQSIADFYPDVKIGGIKAGEENGIFFTDEICGDRDLSGKRVLLVDEVVESGNTLIFCKKMLTEKYAANVKTACMYLYANSRAKTDYYSELFEEKQNMIFPWRYLRDMLSMLDEVMSGKCWYDVEEIADNIRNAFKMELPQKQILKHLMSNNSIFVCDDGKWRKIDEL